MSGNNKNNNYESVMDDPYDVKNQGQQSNSPYFSPGVQKQQPAYQQPTMQPQILPQGQVQVNQQGYSELTSSPYARQMPQNQVSGVLSPQERFGFCEDYIQKYAEQILNEQEYQSYKSERLQTQCLGGAFAIATPFTMIYTFSAKYDMALYYPKLIRNLGILGGLGFLWYRNRTQQKVLHQIFIDKYFGQYSDHDIQQFDIMMFQHNQAQIAQYQQEEQQALIRQQEEYYRQQQLQQQQQQTQQQLSYGQQPTQSEIQRGSEKELFPDVKFTYGQEQQPQNPQNNRRQ